MGAYKIIAFLFFMLSALTLEYSAELFALWGIFWLVGGILDKPEKAQRPDIPVVIKTTETTEG